MDKPNEPTPFERFDSLAKRIFAVPKTEVDELAEKSPLHKTKKPKPEERRPSP